jgi:predicted DNA-binding transcriptional regulator AlpA
MSRLTLHQSNPTESLTPTEAATPYPSTNRPTVPPAAAVEPLLLSARQAAKVCGVSLATWHRMASAGRCPAPVRLSRGCVRWRKSDLEEWIFSGCPPRREFEARQATISGKGRK